MNRVIIYNGDSAYDCEHLRNENTVCMPTSKKENINDLISVAKRMRADIIEIQYFTFIE